MNKATLEQMMRFKFLSDVDALREYIENKQFRQKLQNEVTVLVVGTRDISARRLSLLKGIFHALDNAKTKPSESFHSYSESDLNIQNIDESLKCTRDVISKLDELSPEIIAVINNSKTDVTYTKNRLLQIDILVLIIFFL